MNYVLITGGSSGIGLALAKCFAKDGYGLLLTATNEIKLDVAVAEIKRICDVPIKKYLFDLSKPGTAQELYDAVQRDGIKVDVLVNNAGVGTIGPTEQIPVEKDETLMAVNMIAPVILTKLFLKDMYQRQHGKILNVCSTGAFQPGPYTATYYASKSFLLSYTKAVRYEAKRYGVCVCALCPGTTATGFFERADSKTPKGAMSADAVAEYAYRQLQKNKEVAIPGISYRLMKIFPEKIKTIAVALIKRPRT